MKSRISILVFNQRDPVHPQMMTASLLKTLPVGAFGLPRLLTTGNTTFKKTKPHSFYLDLACWSTASSSPTN